MQRLNERFFKTDIASWYDSEQRQLWMINDPIAEREDAWNLWYVFDVYGFLITDYRWWGMWMPSMLKDRRFDIFCAMAAFAKSCDHSDHEISMPADRHARGRTG